MSGNRLLTRAAPGPLAGSNKGDGRVDESPTHDYPS